MPSETLPEVSCFRDGNLLQEDDTSPEQLDYPDEDVWTLPPAPEDEDNEEDTDDGKEVGKDTEEHELSDAAEKVVDRLMDRLKQNLET
ncbi:hypothetical protein GGP80_003184 [Salinibacter ruber]|uniref:hypothetical protein n=1 Tax=Salinibacter ruber TaxID=146919 RepID=UPI002074814D|nr:hypothetical protein [Salinibacter ruber]MCS3937175.1 hypothetical protein [Salinibacter ruber]MCS4099950.1 hypothetical protein [Salinibacter ruber]MCS4119565.1 hypothetical protein [Salinibacter ruber]